MKLDALEKSQIFRLLILLAGLVCLFFGCVVVLKPFIPAVMLAIIFCLSTWPAYAWLQRRIGCGGNLAAFLMTLFLALCFIVPLAFLGSSLAENFSRFMSGTIGAMQHRPLAIPAWFDSVPWAKPYMDKLWAEYAGNSQQMTLALRQYAGPASQKVLAVSAAIGRGLLDLSLGILIAFFFFRHGAQVAERLNVLIAKFIGPRGQHLLNVSKKTMIGVVYGMLGTALAQGTLAGIGFWVAGVPGAPLLGVATFLLSFIPMGPPFIWVPATIWLFGQDMIGAAVFMAVWGLLVVSAIDNVIRPYFISLGSQLPFLLVLIGILGGLLAFGFIGFFIGPTLLAVAYTLVIEWSQTVKMQAETSSAPA